MSMEDRNSVNNSIVEQTCNCHRGTRCILHEYDRHLGGMIENRTANLLVFHSRARPEPKIQRKGTLEALRRIFNNWKRGNSILPSLSHKSWSVCLSDFKQKEVLIQLKCGSLHCFHYEWIKQWAIKNNRCPICNSNFVDQAKRECAYGQNHLSVHSISYENIV